MNIPFKEKTHQLSDFSFKTKRSNEGVIELWTKDVNQMSKAMGFIHSHDRKMQMLLVRVISQGRLSECIKADQSTIEIDQFMREMAFHSEAKKEVEKLEPETREYLQAYADGFNEGLKKHGPPIEFKLFRYKPEPWKIEDSLAAIKIMSYIGLAQTQQEIEKLIIQMINNKVDLEKVKSLFTPHLDNMTTEQVSLIEKVNLFQTSVPKNVQFMSAVPKLLASNNWVLSPNKTTTNSAYQCNDPHLEVNRLPAIWYEFVAHTDSQDYLGVNMPGVPGTIMGRSNNISFGFTYGFMDLVDYFIEEIKDGKYRTETGFSPLRKRVEVLKPKNSPEISFTFYETDNGIIEHDNKEEIPDGLYLARSWSGHKDGAKGSVESLFKINNAKDVFELKDVVKEITISCNWLLSDDKGNIAFQQSGQFPHRQHSGVYPVQGWIKENKWLGLRPKDDLAEIVNPEWGFITTANNDMNQEGKPTSINMPMGSYRADRISDLLIQKEKFSIDDMKKIQCDLFSNQARDFMKISEGLIPHGKAFDIFEKWDFCYDKHSKGAVLFEEFYKTLFSLVFGEDFVGESAWEIIQSQTHTLIDFYPNFDAIFLNSTPEIESIWFSKTTKANYIEKAMKITCDHFQITEVPTWGNIRKTPMKNILFDGNLPKFLGFDYGPISIEGSRATIVQGALYTAHDRVLTFCPSYRFITDMGTRTAYTVLAGGVSDRRFNKLYTSDVERWLNYEYKELNL